MQKSHRYTGAATAAYCILETSNFVLMISSSESSTGKAGSPIDDGIFSSTQRKSSSSVVVAAVREFVGVLADPFWWEPRILTPYASATNWSSSSEMLEQWNKHLLRFVCMLSNLPSSSSSSGLSSNGVKAYRWLLFVGRHNIIMTSSSTENSTCQKPVSIQISRQPCRKQ